MAKCTVIGCKKEIFKIFKVQVFHPNSGRKTWQTWKHCKEHFIQFIKFQGQQIILIIF
jgi:hypothetical protein